MKPSQPPLRPVLLIEDNDDDVLFLRYAFGKLGSQIPLLVMTDGQAAWEFLVGSGFAEGPSKPSLILLDLKLPRKSGIEILSSVRRNKDLQKIPVLVLTSSSERIDIDRAYESGADFYVVKPFEAERRLEIAEAIHDLWLAVCADPESIGADPSSLRLRKMAEPMPSSH
jgi:CheY-like chemotaxis protein